MPRGAAVLIAFLALAAPASAQGPEPGVTPDSPAGKEYALPLNSARNTGGAGGGGVTANGIVQAGTPFGVGIGPSARAALGAGATTLRPNGKAIPLSPDERKKIQAIEAQGSGGMPIWMILLPIGIVLVAGAAGLGLALVSRRVDRR